MTNGSISAVALIACFCNPDFLLLLLAGVFQKFQRSAGGCQHNLPRYKPDTASPGRQIRETELDPGNPRMQSPAGCQGQEWIQCAPLCGWYKQRNHLSHLLSYLVQVRALDTVTDGRHNTICSFLWLVAAQRRSRFCRHRQTRLQAVGVAVVLQAVAGIKRPPVRFEMIPCS